jgi:hypothetical protein
MKFAKLTLILIAVLCLSSSPALAGIIYSQPFDFTGNAYSSQNDTNGFGLFAQVYDDFKVNFGFTVESIQFTGEYFNPPQHGDITGWTVQFYSDANGQPGSLLYSVHFAGTGNETSLGTFGGFPTFTYDINGLNFSGNYNTQYWLSVYPDLGFPPQWGWSSGTGGDGLSYQDFFGARSPLAADMAFTLGAGCAWPDSGCMTEPGSLLLLASGLLGLIGMIRRH